MRKYEKLRRMVSMLVLVFGVLCLLPSEVWGADTSKGDMAALGEEDTLREVYIKGEVVQIVSEQPLTDPLNPESGVEYEQQVVKVKLEHPYSGKIITIEHSACISNTMQGPVLHQGERIIVYANVDNDNSIVEAYVADLDRSRPVMIICGAFVLILLALSGRKGIAALLTIMLTGILIWYGLIPLILKGANPRWCGVGVCIVVTLVGIPLIGGFNRTSLAAVIGSISGVTLAGILAHVIGNNARIVGVDFEYANQLLSLPATVHLDLQGIFFAGVLIGALGAVMDTSISIASAIREFAEIHGSPTRYSLWRAGMNVGKDVMGMMSSTLILAYTGGALALLLLLVANEISALNIMNWDMIVSEIVRSMAGSIGLCLSIPVTALAASFLVGSRQEK